MQRAFYETCCKVHAELCRSPHFSAELSGTTLTALFVSGDRLYTSNVGDSRTILVSFEEDARPDQFEIKQLTKDHKPNEVEESRRIYQAGGKVAQAKDARGNSSGPFRIYNKKLMNPGLAMSRSLGDHFAHTLGCSCEPDFLEHQLQPRDRIVVLASDGVWEYLTNEEVAKILIPFYKPKSERKNRIQFEDATSKELDAMQSDQRRASMMGLSSSQMRERACQATQALTEAAEQAWRNNHKVSGQTDDITCVVLFFDMPKVECPVDQLQ